MPDTNVFTDIPYSSPATPATAAEEVKAYASQFFNTLEDLCIGVGETAFKVDKSGMWLGGNLFSEAPFRVDMLGNVTANSILINGLGGDIIAGAIDEDGNFVNEIISTTLNTQSKEILAEFEFGVSGAIAMATDANNGVWISPTGILGKKAGAVTFAIENDGDATFGGTLVAASGTFGTVTAGSLSGVTITGSTIKANNGAGSDVWIDNTGTVDFRYGGSSLGYLFASTSAQIALHSGNDMAIDADDTLVIAAGSTLDLFADSGISLNFNWNGGTDSFLIYTNGSNVLQITSAGNMLTSGNIRCGGTFESSDGTDGMSGGPYGFMTSIRHDSGNVQAKFREITIKDGLVTNIGSESGWITMDTI